jgi:hypothetical protein
LKKCPWRTQFILTDPHMLLGLAKDDKLSACGRQPTFPFILLSLYFCLFVCFAFVVFFKTSVCHSSLGGAFFYGTPNLYHPFGIVFLVTLGTMCHFSLGVG